jgi:8-oxo-dGTP pyrophosphatase MutT (NUDIX family)
MTHGDRNSLPTSNADEAGAIVVKLDEAPPRVLLVTAKANHAHWIFPKGHIETNESPQEAALREAREEAGVIGRILEPAGTLEFQLGNEQVHVRFFLVAFEGWIVAQEKRSTTWCTLEEALEKLTFTDARELLQAAWPRIAASSSNASAARTCPPS